MCYLCFTTIFFCHIHLKWLLAVVNASKLYLSQGIWQWWVHMSRPFPVKDCSLNWYNWLNWTRILYSHENNWGIHGTHGIEQVLLTIPARVEIIYLVNWKLVVMETRGGLCNCRKFDIYIFLLQFCLCSLPFSAYTPEHCSKQQGNHCCVEVFDSSIWRVSPIWHTLLPQASETLCEESLRVFGWKR